MLGRLGEEVACCGGWRRHSPTTIAPEDRGVLVPDDAEIKRMWVEPAHPLYRSAGYRRVPNFGVYRDDPESLCLARELTAPRGGAGTGTG